MASQATQYPCRKSVAHAQRPGNFSWKPQTGFATCPCFGGCKKSAACGLGVQNDDNPLCFCAVWGGHIANPAKFFLIHDSESEWKTSKRTRATFITTCHESSLQHKSLSHHKTMDHVLEWTKIVHQLVWSQLPLVYHGFSSGTQPGYMKMFETPGLHGLGAASRRSGGKSLALTSLQGPQAATAARAVLGGDFGLVKRLCITTWKINMEHTNHPFRKENDLPNLYD